LGISKAVEMNFILYIKCTEKQDFSYANPFLETIDVKKIAADFLDIDNFSSTELVESALKALEKSDKCAVIIDIQTNTELPNLYKIIYYLIDHSEKCLVFLQGKHLNLEKILRTEPEIFNHDMTGFEIQNKIIAFLK
jgi:hypothetical protein